jgi:hypothetical protein
VNYTVQDSSGALENAGSDLLGCPHRSLRDVACRFDGASPSGARKDSEGKNHRDECFHLLISTHDETFSINVMRVNNKDY